MVKRADRADSLPPQTPGINSEGFLLPQSVEMSDTESRISLDSSRKVVRLITLSNNLRLERREGCAKFVGDPQRESFPQHSLSMNDPFMRGLGSVSQPAMPGTDLANIRTHANLITSTFPLPRILIRSGLKLHLEKPVLQIPEYKTPDGFTRLATYGMFAYTPSVKFTCSMNSFFTALTLIHKFMPDFILKHFILYGSAPETVLKHIASSFARINLNRAPIIVVPELKSEMNNWKKLWIEVNFPTLRPYIEAGIPIHLGRYAHEARSIISPLYKSSMFYYTQRCSRLHLDGNYDAGIHPYSAYSADVTLDDLKGFANTRFPVKERLKPLNLKHTIKFEPEKKHCQADKLLQYLFVPQSTWLLYFEMDHIKDNWKTINPHDIPKVIFVQDLIRPGLLVSFSLAYVTIGEHPYHQTSYHWINNKFFYYDDANNGILTHDPNPIDYIRRNKCQIAAAVYFRI